MNEEFYEKYKKMVKDIEVKIANFEMLSAGEKDLFIRSTIFRNKLLIKNFKKEYKENKKNIKRSASDLKRRFKKEDCHVPYISDGLIDHNKRVLANYMAFNDFLYFAIDKPTKRDCTEILRYKIYCDKYYQMTKEITNKYISNVDNGVDYRGNKMLFEYFDDNAALDKLTRDNDYSIKRIKENGKIKEHIL